MKEVVPAYMGLYYLLDFDYPPAYEIAFTVLHFLLFDDKATPGDLFSMFTSTMREYMAYKKSQDE